MNRSFRFADRIRLKDASEYIENYDNIPKEEQRLADDAEYVVIAIGDVDPVVVLVSENNHIDDDGHVIVLVAQCKDVENLSDLS